MVRYAMAGIGDRPSPRPGAVTADRPLLPPSLFVRTHARLAVTASFLVVATTNG